MTQAPAARAGGSLPATVLSRFFDTGSLPDTRGHRLLVGALSVDTLGVGLFLPLAFYFFTVTTGLPVAGVGLTISAATLGALALGPFGGLLTDRLGAKRTVVLSNLLSAAGYACYPLADSYLGILGCVALVMTADRLYFASWPTLITSVSRPGQLDSWFALVQAVSAGSLGTGALVSTVFLANHGTGALRVIVLVNAATCLLAGVLIACCRVTPAPATATASDGAAPRATRRHVFADRAFRRLILAQLLIAAAWTVPAAFLPLYLTRVLHLGQWYATLVFAVNYLLLFVAQLWVTHRVRRARRTRVVLGGTGLLLTSLALTSCAAGFSGWLAAACVLAGVAVYSFGEMLVSPSSYALVAALAPDELRGFYMSLFQMTGAIAFGIGPGVAGLLFDLAPLAVPAAVAGCVLAGAALLYLGEGLFPALAQRRTEPAELPVEPSPVTS
ncbi:MFS transporter [Kitasatospora sp. McL0602]|uniref:MFS transporter n=1 Tax=Kitasatospora sp. McL0602 TaxID=3439530 RepID=UPI003F8C4BC4